MRKFRPFDPDTIMKEMRALPNEDFAALKWAMEQYQNSGDAILPPAQVDDQDKYGEKYRPIFKIRHRNGKNAGRAFFYFGGVTNGDQPMFVLLVYKKESDEVPKHLLESAYQRMRKHRERN